MTLIVFVCRGNTCRSPLAEALAKRQCTDAHLLFTAAGVAPSPIGGPASSGAQAIAKLHGLDLSAHQSRAADRDLLSSAAHIVALDRSVRDELIARTPPALHHRIKLLMSYTADMDKDDVADPWNGTAEHYAHAFHEIETVMPALIAAVSNQPRQNPPIGSV
jgi:protein-tyrosine-phosphatase